MSKELFFRKVTKSGGSRVLALGSILPFDWEIVRVKVLRRADHRIIIEIFRVK